MKTVGLTVSQRIVAGLVDDNKLAGPLQFFPEKEDDDDALVQMPREEMIRVMCEEIATVSRGITDLGAVGIALPGIIKNGVVEDSPNLPQLKGARVEEQVAAALAHHNFHIPVKVMNDADSVAAGLAANHGKLDHVIRVWTLGTGIGFGRYPLAEGVLEGGHTVVTLDDKETYCGCGGRGHIEGIMGHRAMRLRFLDMEPEDVFEAAAKGDARCLLFKKLWHKALAAGTASSIHMSGAGKFYLTGYNVRFVDLQMLQDYISQMVRMSPLLSFSIEIRPEDVGNEVLGAAVLARQSAK
jgi:glucokinase